MGIMCKSNKEGDGDVQSIQSSFLLVQYVIRYKNDTAYFCLKHMLDSPQ